MADDYDPEKHAREAFESILVIALRFAPDDRWKQVSIVTGNCITAILAALDEDNLSAAKAFARCYRAWGELLVAEEGIDTEAMRPQIEAIVASTLEEVRKGTAFAD